MAVEKRLEAPIGELPPAGWYPGHAPWVLGLTLFFIAAIAAINIWGE